MSSEQALPSLNGWNAEYVDQLYEQWLANPNAVDARWQQFFQGFDLGYRTAPAPDGVEGAPPRGAADIAHTDQGRVDSLIYHYRDIGHASASIDPLSDAPPLSPKLALDSFGLTESKLDESFDPGRLPLPNPAPLRDIIACLQDTYCRHIGVEYMHIQDRERRHWLQRRMEASRNRPTLEHDQKKRILRELIEADALESFLAVRYQGKKRFSLEGADSVNCMLNEMIDGAPGQGINELTIGMAHRGRINVLVNILNKSYRELFSEFEESWVEDFIEGGGDVKYHRGYSSDHVTSSGETIHLTLSPNPSHLEFVNPVVLGRARAKQRLRKDTERHQCVPVLLHGDAAFPGQGIVAEMFNMSKLDGYQVGGAVHVIINNQVGFTTNPSDAHSGQYCTDIAKMVEAPIFHVNGDDPEACAYVAMLAIEWRQTFHTDVVIDMLCYRKYGHNEGDEPSFTQPLLYKKIRKHEPVLRQYVDRLVSENVITREDFNQMYEDHKQEMDEAQSRSKEQPVDSTVAAYRSAWAGLQEDYSDDPFDTSASADDIKTVGTALSTVPDGFNVHKQLMKRILGARGESILNDGPLDWGMGEMLAYGTLLLEGHAVRLTGQDVERGTFSHRHAMLVDQETGEGYVQLNNLGRDTQGRFCVHNSPLTENACVGFEYGYSLGDPHMLVIWEAQFGDFCNGAQVFYDQFLSSAEVKWSRSTGLVLLLPHGYEGAGPEHSSARLERFLQLCAQNNMQVAYPTTPAQQFHLLRRQMKRNFRKPLIVMTPKSLLRHPKAVSTVNDLTNDRFHHVLDDPAVTDPSAIRQLLLCSGKVYYDLIAHREEVGRDDVAVIRLEQLYPLNANSLRPILEKYAHASCSWVQEEPRNMGAWSFISERLREEFDLDVHYVGRDRAASPAVASEKMHRQEQHRIMVNALGIESSGGGGTTKKKSPRKKNTKKTGNAKSSDGDSSSSSGSGGPKRVAASRR